MVDYQQWIRELSISEPKLEVFVCFFHFHDVPNCAPAHINNTIIKNNTVYIFWQISDTSILETMYKNHSNLETIFRIIDTDHSGQ